MAKQIYYVMSCDEWASTDSMRLVFIGTSKQKMKMFISKEIENGNMEYKFDCDAEPNRKERERMAKEFRKDFEVLDRWDLNNYLNYGTFDYCYDNDPGSL